MDNIAIKRENVTKFLGVLIDENLSWKQDINDDFTNLEEWVVKQPLLKQLYLSFIHCHLIYANTAWASTYKSKLERLFRHQKLAARIVNFKDRFTHAQPLLHDMKALNIVQINLCHIIYYMLKCKEDSSPIFSWPHYSQPENKYNIRSRGKLKEAFYREKCTQFNIDCRGPHLWNELAHDNFSKLDSLPLFHKKIKEFILMFLETEQYF